MTRAAHRPRSSSKKNEWTELAQTRVSKKAKALIVSGAAERAISETAYHRQLLYKALGLIEEKDE